jgi:hypothetical protein
VCNLKISVDTKNIHLNYDKDIHCNKVIKALLKRQSPFNRPILSNLLAYNRNNGRLDKFHLVIFYWVPQNEVMSIHVRK